MTKKSREARSVIAGSGHQGTLTGRKYAALGERCTSVSCHQWPRYGWQLIGHCRQLTGHRRLTAPWLASSGTEAESK